MKSFVENKRTWVALSMVLLTVVVFELPSPFLDSLFIFPSGFIGAWLTGASPQIGEEAVYFAQGYSLFAVTSACSGIGFFGILLALAFYAKLSAARVFTLLPLVYGYVVFCNAIRISLWSEAFPILGARVLEGSLPLVHELAGAVVFLPGLIFGYLVFVRIGRVDSLSRLNCSQQDEEVAV